MIKKFDKYFESNEDKLTREEEAELGFEEAYSKGRSYPNLEYLSNDWEKISSKYHLYDEYYLYKDSILKLLPDGDWGNILDKIDTPLDLFKEKLFARIQELEDAFGKLNI